MAPILVKTFSIPTGSEAWQYITIVLTYSISMAARPVGSAIFGHYADTIGRRFLLILTIGGVGVLSLISAVLPTYGQIGPWAYIIFALLRFVMGCFFGGEYAVGHTFAIECAPRSQAWYGRRLHSVGISLRVCIWLVGVCPDLLSRGE